MIEVDRVERNASGSAERLADFQHAINHPNGVDQHFLAHENETAGNRQLILAIVSTKSIDYKFLTWFSGDENVGGAVSQPGPLSDLANKYSPHGSAVRVAL